MDFEPQVEWPVAPVCYFFSGGNTRCPIPILSNKYDVTIKNNFAEIKTTQKYMNPFEKNL